MATRKQPPEPRIEVKAFTIPEIDSGTRKIRRRIEEVHGLGSQNFSFDDARVDTAENNIREAIREVFGPNSPEFHDHQRHAIWHGGYNLYDDQHTRQEKFTNGITQTVL